jgi:uroporphyrinogen decarboxylase
MPQVEISLQPWRAFRPDGVILFSDILTPLTGMGIPFDITAGKGPIIHEPIRTLEVCCWPPVSHLCLPFL